MRNEIDKIVQASKVAILDFEHGNRGQMKCPAQQLSEIYRQFAPTQFQKV
jgi:hypothetical protein